MKLAVAAAFAFALLASPAAQADDSALIGKWTALDQPGKAIEFLANGEFHYVYDIGPPRTELQIYWKTGWFSKVTLSMANGGNARACYYKVAGDELTLDNGSGKSCIDNQPVNMAQHFKRAK